MAEDTTTGRRRGSDDGFAATEAGAAAPRVSPTRTMFGRYLVVDRLGRGGMGEVFAAYDPELDRKIALKRVRVDEHATNESRSRLLREAQAMAKIRHPNVIAVFDVGELDDEVFIAMELVDGETLRAWIERGPALVAIVDAFVQAARGLEAAHAVDVVHRDFKPDNAMVDRSGRVQVLDFGLAASAGLGASSSEAAVGTPAYMSPEQYAGSRADARSDQFALCVALFEAIHGQRPFIADTLPALAASVTSGSITEPTKTDNVPAWLDRAVRRGLARDPAMRWPSVAALREQLERGLARTRRGRTRWLAVSGVAALGIAAAIGFLPDDKCESATKPVDDLWNERVRGELGSAFASAPGPLGGATWPDLAARLDARAEAWRGAYAEVCAAAQGGPPEAIENADRRRVCLHEQTHALASALEVLAIADADVIAHAPAMIEALPDPTTCAGVLATAATSTLDSATREDVRRTAALAQSLIHAGKPALAKERIDERLAAGGVADDPAAASRLGVLRASALRSLGDMKSAAVAIETAYLHARATDSRELVLDAEIEYVALFAALREPKSARQWIERARVEARALHDARALAVLDGREAQALAHAGLLDEALAKADAAISSFEDLGLGDTQQAIDVVSNRGTILFSRGDLEQARAAKVEALRREAKLVDGEHPMMAKLISDLGTVAIASGDLAAAKEYLARGLALVESAYAEPHPAIGESLVSMGGFAAESGDYDEARRYYDRALANLIPTVGEDSPSVAIAYNNLAAVLLRTGFDREGIEAHRHAIAIRERILAPDHPDLAVSYANLASALSDTSDPEVEMLYRKALAILQARDRPKQRLSTEALFASWLADRRRDDEAKTRADRVLAAPESSGEDRVYAHYALATIATGDARRVHARAAIEIGDVRRGRIARALRELAGDDPPQPH